MIIKDEAKPDYKKIVVDEYSFSILSGPNNQVDNKNIHNYSLAPLDKVISKEKKALKAIIKKESLLAEESHFKISDIVKEYRGIRGQEKEEFEQKVRAAVEEELKNIKEEQIKIGIDIGIKIGEEKAKIESDKVLLEKTQILEQIIQNIADNQEKIILEQEIKILEFLTVLVKWIILRELKDDGAYLKRLLQVLMAELGQQDHLVIKVNKNYFKGMEDIVQTFKEKLGVLHNCRIEIDHYQENMGIILESQAGLVDGSFETQMNRLNTLFDKEELKL